MAEADRTRLRATFDEAAERYDRARPGYPPAVFDDLAELAGVGPGRRVLEIGCGTGQATVPLAERGCQIVAVELGAGLAAVARRKLARFRLVQVAVAAFEDWPLSPDPFDVVLAATAFHWIDPGRARGQGRRRAATRRCPGGHLHPPPRRRRPGVLHRRAGLLRRLGSGDHAARASAAHRGQVPMRGDELDRSGRFGPVAFGRHEWELSYSTAAYPGAPAHLLRPHRDDTRRPRRPVRLASPTSSTAATAGASPSAT
jgi:SAM-dependent methyltransferase